MQNHWTRDAAGFRLLRYFTVASLAAFLPVAAALLYIEVRKNEFLKEAQQEQEALIAQMQNRLVQRHDAAAPAFLLQVYESGNVNLARLFAKALWEPSATPFVARAQQIPVDRCRAIADLMDAGAAAVQPGEKQACFAAIGRQIMALPEFRALDAKVLGMMSKGRVSGFKVYDPRGITVYSSAHTQIGEDRAGGAGWQSAMAGKPASELVRRGKFSAFEGAVENRDLATSYVPVPALGSDKIAAVFEINSDVTQFVEQVRSTSSEIQQQLAANRAGLDQAAAASRANLDARANLMFAIVLGVLALLYLALWFIVRRGQGIIDRQGLERQQAGLALLWQKNLYDVLSQSNKAIVHIVERDELFATVCRIAVEHGRFLFAWIGLLKEPDQRLKPVASYGEDAGYVKALEDPGTHASDSRRGLTGRTLLSGAHVVSNDFLNDSATAPWHAAAARAGVRAAAKFPIRQTGAVVGAISLYAREVGFFSADLIATLEEMASDVSFALDNYAREAARKQAAGLLEESEHRYRSVIQSAIDGFCIADITGRILDVNDAYCRLLGYQREELLKMRIQDVEALESPEDTARHFREILTKGHDRFETRNRRKNGGLVDVEISTNVNSTHGEERFFAFLRDISERKRADAALRAAAEQFRGLVEQSIAGTYIIQDGKLVYANPRFAEILGYGSAGELIGRDPLFLVAEKDRGTVKENIRRRLEGDVVSLSYSFSAVRKDGSTIEVGVHGARATYGNRPAIIGLMQDISEKKRAEEQIQRYIVQLEGAFMRTVEVATTLSEMRDPYTAGHERRVAEIAVAIGAELGFDARRQEGLRVAGFLHDIGKIIVPSEILAKPGKLSAIEFQLIQQHAQAGFDVLKDVGFPWPVAEVALQHHERLDGSGYPNRLKGNAILFEARILAVADTVEAMASHRPYRPGLGIDKALAEIERGRGSAYDPLVVDACLKLFREKGYSIPA